MNCSPDPLSTLEPIDPEHIADPSNVVIFGATGDLTKRKLMPALLRMLRCGLMHAQSRIIGIVHHGTEAEWHTLIREGLMQFSREAAEDPALWELIRPRLVMISGGLEDLKTFEHIRDEVIPIEGQRNAMFYCAIPPQWYGEVARGLQAVDLVDEDDGYRRLVIEKPFGHDLASAQSLDAELQAAFSERQIYRIDHYLGKESVQSLLVHRFANGIMEPLWNRNYIDNVQISAAESLGIEYRAAYYEKSGALRDMIQSHLMQVMTLVAMEAPVAFTADAVRDEKIKVLRAVRPFDTTAIQRDTVSAQYSKGQINHQDVPAYVAEDGVAPDSVTETFAAVKFYIDNWRWQGVPFILSSGKRLRDKVSEVVINFRRPPFNLFDSHASVPAANALVFRLQPDSSVKLHLNAKKPGLTTDNEKLVMHAPYADDTANVAGAYEILMHDVLIGDGTLFSRADEVEASWAILEPVFRHWHDRVSINRYRAGSNAIPQMEQLLEGCVGGWHLAE